MASQSSELKGKRKKKLPPNANPLFTKWLTEWKNEASEKGWKSAHTYGKALKTLKLFPLPLETGKDCRLLQNFGDKICQMLDERLEQYKREKGTTDLSKESSTSTSTHVSQAKVKAKRVNEKTSHRPKSTVQASSPTKLSRYPSTSLSGSRPTEIVTNGYGLDSRKVHTISDSSDSEAEVEEPPKKKRQSSTTRTKEYVPAYRSGPYALLVTLHKYMQGSDFKGFMTKTELAHAAQPLCDKSFIIPDPGSRYTAWSSMGTLIKKGLISKSSNPAKFSLTDEGHALADRLVLAEIYRETSESDIMSPTPSQRSMSSEIGTSSPPSSTRSCLSPHSSSGSLSRLSTVTSSHTLSQGSSVSTDLGYRTEQSDQVSGLEQNKEFTGCPTISKNKHSANTRYPLNSLRSNHNDAVDEVFILSDDDDEVDGHKNSHKEVQVDAHPLRISSDQPSPVKQMRLHSLSPSPSPSPASVINLPADNAPSPSTYNTNSDPKQDLNTSDLSWPTSPKVDILNQNFDNSVLEISDDEDECVVNVREPPQFPRQPVNAPELPQVSKQPVNVPELPQVPKQPVNVPELPQVHKQPETIITDDSSDDELPDLDVPLWKRLLQKGKVQPGLLQATVGAQCSDTVSQTSSKTSQPDPISKLTNENSHVKEKCSNTVSTSNEVIDLEMIEPSSPDPPSKTASDLCDNVSKFVSAGSSSSTFLTNSRCNSNANVNSDWSQNGNNSHRPGVCDTGPQTSSEPVIEFTLKPGTYEIVLCLDNREFYGKKSSSKTLLPELMKAGVQCDLRLLHVGDLLWIAKEKVPIGEDKSKGRELVLDYVVERKRMDDLVSSMTDGRMKEQKFRLKHCGLRELIILIEEYGSIQNFSLSEDRIMQSIVNSQVIDGFKVKRCGGTNEAVVYLATMTRFLQQHYQNKTLHAVTQDYCKEQKHQRQFGQREQYLMPFYVFNEASVKQKDLTASELFAKQLIQIPGVSAERAKAITNVYPTLVSLLDAYKMCGTDKEKEKMLAYIKCGKKERNLGQVLSKLLAMLYTETGRLP